MPMGSPARHHRPRGNEPSSGSAPTPPPANLTRPVITGSLTQGSTLTLTPGVYTNSPTGYTRQWYNLTTGIIAGQTGLTYVSQAGDVGDDIYALEIASNAGGSSPATESNVVGPIASGGTVPAPTVLSWSINAAATALTLNMSESSNASSGAGVTLTDTWTGNSTSTIGTPTGSGTATLVFPLTGSTPYVSDICTLAYNASTGNIVASGSGNTPLATFSATSTGGTNSSMVVDPNLYFFLVVGQSNGTGNGGYLVPFNPTAAGNNSQALTTTPQTFGYCLAPGTIPLNNNSAAPSFPDASLVPLSGIFCGGDSWSGTSHGENLLPALCRYLNNLTGKNYGGAVAAYDGYSVSEINSGTNPYNNGILYVKELNQQAPIKFGGNAVCLGIIYVGGEQDAVIGSPVCTVAAGSNGLTFPLVNATISTSAFTTGTTTQSQYPATNGALIMQSTVGPQYITYTSAVSGTFSGCNGGTATGACGLTGGQLQTGHQIYNANYTLLLKAFASGLASAIAAITPNSNSGVPIPMYLRQQFGYAAGITASGSNAGRTAWQDYCILRDDIAANPLTANRKFWMFTAEYAAPGIAVQSGLHINNGAQRQQGEMLGKVAFSVNYGGTPFDNVRPSGISRVTNVITLTVQTPMGQGYYNPRQIKAYYNGSNNPTMGLSYQDSSGAIAVNSVVMTPGTSSIVFTITLASDPSANTTKLLRAGWIGEAATNGLGHISGPRTNVFAASPATSNYGYSLDDPMILFEEGVP